MKTRTFRGLVYVKHGRIGSRSEGPDYYLQTEDHEYLLKLHERHPKNPDYELGFYARRIVLVTGELIEKPVIQVSEIQDTGERLIVPPGEE